MKRMLSSESKVQSGKLRDGRLSNEEMNRLFEAGNGLAESQIYLDDTGSIKVNQIFSKCRKLKSEQDSLSMIVIDYLQLITGSRSDSRQQEVSEISRSEDPGQGNGLPGDRPVPAVPESRRPHRA